MEAERIEPILQVVPDYTVENPMLIPTPFDGSSASDYRWTDVQAALGTSSNVPNARWMPQKLAPLFQGLDTPPLTVGSRCSRFGAQMLYRYKLLCIDGTMSYEQFADEVLKEFPSVANQNPGVSSEGSFGVTRPDTSSVGLATFDQQGLSLAQTDQAIASLIVRAVEAGKAAQMAESAYHKLSDAQRQQQIIAEEVQKFTAAQEGKKEEFDLRLKVQQALQAQVNGDED